MILYPIDPSYTKHTCMSSYKATAIHKKQYENKN